MKLKWLEEQPTGPTGITWGVPWKKGELNRHESISLTDHSGEKISVQTWPTAFWPDGSVKWTGHATVLGQEPSEYYHLSIDENVQESQGIQINECDQIIEIETGKLTCQINRQGKVIIRALSINNNSIGSDGKLVAIKEEHETSAEGKVIKQKRLEGEIQTVTIEQTGSMRAVIKIEGIHVGRKNQELFPFIIRLYFYADVADVKIVHTFIYDGDPEVDFIKGLGIEFKGGFTGEAWNRHIQVAGDEGMYGEPAQLTLTRRYAGDLYTQQIAGEAVDPNRVKGLANIVQENALWNDFKLIQDSADHYYMAKRTESGCSWVEMLHGKRAQGLLYAGGTNGGLAVGMKDFWQKHPTSLEINDLTKDQSTIRIWLWSPDCQSMDFRHYSKHTHVESAYEGFDEMRATPEGIANTSEVYLSCFATQPTSEELFQSARKWQEGPLLVCEPQYYYETQALGVWSLPDHGDRFLSVLEEQLDQAFQFYKREIDQRSWYGYWNYGDVMHTYDPVRHQWRYDLGGFAWQNTELVPNIWLWYSFLRTGKAEVFKMAEAMTRHTSEVDRYHLGEYSGLGTRHNVMHWGCGCKEVRIAMAGLHKFYYYLTTDERTGDLLTSVRDADHATATLPPMREFFPKDQYPTHVRSGPDWSSFCSNWLCEWERTGNEHYKNKIVTGINDLKELPLRLLSGPTFGYDPETSHLHHMGDGITRGYHMIIAFGAPQVWMELVNLLGDQDWGDMVAAFAEFYALSDEEKRKKSDGVLNDRFFHWPMFASGLIAYAAHKKQDQQLAEKAWELLLDHDLGLTPLPIEEQEVTSWKTLREIPWVTTNAISQWCLNTIVCMELIGDMVPRDKIKEVVNRSGNKY